MAARSRTAPRNLPTVALSTLVAAAIDASAITDLDFSAARAVRDLLADLAAKNVTIVFARVSRYLRADMDRHGIIAAAGAAHIFATLHEAIAAVRAGPSTQP